MALSILGMGPVCGLGSGIIPFGEGLAGKKRPATADRTVRWQGGEWTLAVPSPDLDCLEQRFPPRTLRRMDTFSKMALLASRLAFEDAGMDPEKAPQTAMVFGSGYGPTRTTFRFLDDLIDQGDPFASPIHFANSVHNAPASQVSILLKLSGMCTTISCFRRTTAAAFLTAQAWLAERKAETVLVCLGDEYCDVLGAASVGEGAGRQSRMSPLDFDRCTFLPGEACIAFLLSDASAGAGRYGRIGSIDCDMPVSELDADYFGRFDAVLLAANGNRNEGTTYGKLELEKTRVGAYAPLFGGMPVGSALDVAVAAFSLAEKTVFASPNAETGVRADWRPIAETSPDPSLRRIGCVEYCDRDRVNVFGLYSAAST